jgi:hypothetical protein
MTNTLLCISNNCPRKDRCNRHNIKPVEYQPWANLQDICKLTDMSMFSPEVIKADG